MATKISSGDMVLIYYNVDEAKLIIRRTRAIYGWCWGDRSLAPSNLTVLKAKVWESIIFGELHED
jgi:hypothetical protein